jgi:hypothetical protein
MEESVMEGPREDSGYLVPPTMSRSIVGSSYIAKGTIDYNPTVRENLDQRIAKLKAELAEAEASMVTLTPLLDIKIRDIRRAMNY